MSVKLRKRKLANGDMSLYLDIYQGGKRGYEFLGLYLTNDKTTSKGTFELAKAIQAKRLVEIQNSEYGFVPHFKKKANFVDYFERIAQGKPRDDTAWKNTLKHLQTFSSGRIQFSAVTDDGILYVPDFLTNRMGIVNCANEQYGFITEDPFFEKHLSREWEYSIHNTTLRILKESRETGDPPAKVAIRIADELSLQPHPIFGHRGKQIIDSLIAHRWCHD